MGEIAVDFRKQKLWNKNFLLLFLGKIVSQVGDSIYNIAIGWFILSYTGSAVQMGIYCAVGTITYVVACPIGGVISDKVKRKRLVVATDIIRGSVVAGVGIAMFTGYVSMWMFYVSSVILSICGALFMPASNTLIPKVVSEENLTKGNSIMMGVNGIANIFGMIAGGFLYALIGIKGIFIINASSYILSGVSECFISIKEKGVSFKDIDFNLDVIAGDFYEGYKEFKSNRGLFKLIWLGAALNLSMAPMFASFMPFIFNQIIKSPVSHLAYVQAAVAVGGILGSIIMSILPEKKSYFRNIFMGMVGINVVTLATGVFFNLYSSGTVKYLIFLVGLITVFFMFGISQSIMQIPLMGLLQKKISDENMGKAFAVLNTISMMVMPIGMVAGGLMADNISMGTNLMVILIPQIIVTGVIVTQKDIKAL